MLHQQIFSSQLDKSQTFWLILIVLSFFFIVAMVVLIADIAKKPHRGNEQKITVTVHVYRPPNKTNHMVGVQVKVTKPGSGVLSQSTDDGGIATFSFPSQEKGKEATFCAWWNDHCSEEVMGILKEGLHCEIAWDERKSDEKATPLKTSSDEGEARQSYLNAVIADCRTLRLDVLDERAGDPNAARLSLEDVYIALNTTTSRVGRDRRGREKPPSEDSGAFEREDEPPLSVLEALLSAPDRKMVLLGSPGTGKSTFVRFLSLRMAQELTGAKRALEQWEGPAVIPIIVSLGRFAETLELTIKQGSAKLLEKFIQESLTQDERTRLFAHRLLDVSKAEGALFFFDGLDEVADLTLRPVIVQAIDAFVQNYCVNPNSHFLVTCRTYSYQDPNWQLPRWVGHEIALLSDGQIQEFVTAWYEQHALLDQTRPRQYFDKRRDQLLQALKPAEPRQLFRIARYPIILTIMAIVHASYDLPDSRAQVYMRCVDILLVKWQAKRMIQGQEQTRDILKELDIPGSRLQKALFEIAYKAHLGRQASDSEGDGLVTGGLVTSVMEEHLGDNEKLKIFLDYCQSSNGLLMLSGVVKPEKSDSDLPPRRVYTFPHLTFEEYLASRYLEMIDPREIGELLDTAHDRWRTITTMLVEYLCYERNDRLRVNSILEELSTARKGPRKDTDWLAIWLAAELLLVYRRAIRKPASPHEEEIVNGLRDLVLTGALQPRERASAGVTLARLGDPRPEVMTVDGMRFCFVPAGEFWYGEGDKAEKISMPAFWMGEFPVSNAQFVEFVAEEGYLEEGWWPEARDEKFWSKAGFKGRSDDEFRTAPFGFREPFGLLNHPVVGVSWYEAMAFTHWLTARWQGNGWLPALWRVSLPHEQQWEKAARGGLEIPDPAEALPQRWEHIRGSLMPDRALMPNPAERREYPWLGEFQSNRANTYESGIGATSALGCFPLGACPFGIQELSGNVWEWQENWADKDRSGKRLRGGSWNYSQYIRPRFGPGQLRYPYYRFNYLGFRCVLSQKS